MVNKKAFTMSNYLIGLIVFSAIIGLGFLAVSSIGTSYQRTNIIDQSFLNNYDKFNNNTATINQMLNETSGKKGIIGTVEIFFDSTFTVISLIFSSLSSVREQVGFIGSDFGIPTAVSSIVLVLIIMVIVVLIIMTIINAVNKTKPL